MDYMSTVPATKMLFDTNKTESLKLLGLEDHPSVQYCAVIGRLFKVHPIFDEVIVKILQNTNDNTYIVLIAESVLNINRILYQRLKKSFNSLDALHLLTRVKFVDFSHYSHIFNSATCILDTFPYGGCLTTHDAFSNGVPMVTHQ